MTAGKDLASHRLKTDLVVQEVQEAANMPNLAGPNLEDQGLYLVTAELYLYERMLV